MERHHAISGLLRRCRALVLVLSLAMITGVAVSAPPARAAEQDITLTLSAADLGLDADAPRDIVAEMQADIREQGGLGNALKQALADSEVRTAVDTSEWPNFDGTVDLTSGGTGLAITIPGSEITTAGFWTNVAATLIGYAAGYGVRMLCISALVASGVGAATIPLVCTPLQGAITGAITATMVHAFANDLGSPESIRDIIIGALLGLSIGVLWEKYLQPWARTNLPGVIKDIGTWIRSRVPWVDSWLGSRTADAADRLGTELEELEDLLDEAMRDWGGLRTQLRVMPLGDSITAGVESTDGNGYRGMLYNALNAVAGYGQVDFVGSARRGTMADPDNEGHSGWRIDQIASISDCKVAEYQPNVITLHAGTNDFNQDFDLSSAPQRLKNLITQALEYSPKAVIVVAEVIPTGKAGLQPRIDAFNAALPGIVSGLRADGKHVVLTDTSDIEVSEGLQNDAHPDDGGYAKLGYDFYQGIMEAVDKDWIQAADPQQPAPQCQTPDNPADVTALGEGWRKLGVIAPGMQLPETYDRTEIAEMNGDNRADYVQVRTDGSIRVGINTQAEPGHPTWENWGGGTGVSAPAGETDSGASFSPYVRFADIDGNGRDDFLVVLGSLDDAFLVDVWLNLGDGSGPHWASGPRLRIPMKDATLSHIRFADINGDSRDDVLRVSDTGKVHAYFNEPTSGSSQPTWREKLSWAPGVSGAGLANLRFADVDNDQKADYLMVGTDGTVHAYLNKGGKDAGGFEGHHNFANASNYAREYIQFKDISGDGKADYLVVYHGGAVRAWLNRGGNL